MSLPGRGVHASLCALSGARHGEQSWPVLLRMLLSAPPQKVVPNLGLNSSKKAGCGNRLMHFNVCLACRKACADCSEGVAGVFAALLLLSD